MSDEHIKVHQAGMSNLVDVIGAGVEQLTRILDELDSEVSTLRSRWNGEASAAYDRAQETWTVQLRDLTQYLQYARGRAANAQEIFAEAKSRNQQIWS
jgi:WXG100 family type VII secretion target